MKRVQIGMVLAVGLWGCGAQQDVTPSQVALLHANADAQHLGIYSYTVDGDRALMLDQYGMELGQLVVTTPAEGRRLISFALANGTTDEVEVYRPKADGTFFAPISPETMTTAAVADPALAPMLAQHGITFHVNNSNRLAPPLPSAEGSSVEPETIATTTACTGTPCWTGTTPAGCVRCANASLSCTNVSQLPATIYEDTGVGAVLESNDTYTSLSACTSAIAAWCNTELGAGNYGSTSCVEEGVHNYDGQCIGRHMISQWIASCPKATCGTSGDYDAVPRQDACYNPGSCTFQQGTVGCTPYH